jgi:hypothetical protein
MLQLMPVIPQLDLRRSTPTLLSLADHLHSIIPGLVTELDVESARALLSTLLTMVSTAWEWAQTTSDAGGEQRVGTAPDVDGEFSRARPS